MIIVLSIFGISWVGCSLSTIAKNKTLTNTSKPDRIVQPNIVSII